MSWQTCPVGVTVEVPPDGEGEACSICLGQSEADPGGQVVEVYGVDAHTSSVFVGSFVVSARPAIGTRVAAFVALPRMMRWRVLVQNPVSSYGMPLKVAVLCSRATGFSNLTLVQP